MAMWRVGWGWSRLASGGCSCAMYVQACHIHWEAVATVCKAVRLAALSGTHQQLSDCGHTTRGCDAGIAHKADCCVPAGACGEDSLGPAAEQACSMGPHHLPLLPQLGHLHPAHLDAQLLQPGLPASPLACTWQARHPHEGSYYLSLWPVAARVLGHASAAVLQAHHTWGAELCHPGRAICRALRVESQRGCIKVYQD